VKKSLGALAKAGAGEPAVSALSSNEDSVPIVVDCVVVDPLPRVDYATWRSTQIESRFQILIDKRLCSSLAFRSNYTSNVNAA